MDKELKAKWVAALRSGEFKQCKGTLHNGVGYCCLGVLLAVAGEERTHPHTLTLIQERRLGLLSAHHLSTRLENMNDGKKEFAHKPHTFAQIADYIEANL